MKHSTLFILLFVFGIQLSQASPINESRRVIHLVNRLAFGPTGNQLSEIKPQDIDHYIDEQLNPERIQESPDLIKRIEAYSDLRSSPQTLYDLYLHNPATKAKRLAMPGGTFDFGFNRILAEAQEARLIRAVESKRQLQEVMVDFWFNHFNVFANKGGRVKLAVGDYEERVIRPLALGKFGDLLRATAKHPAMLAYLDNWLNTAPHPGQLKGRYRGLNENYARELLELHTLGVDGGYTQEDVIALARILTGWGLCEGKLKSNAPASGFCFDEKRHDSGEKILLGKKFQGHGAAEVEDALTLLATHPATAHHISFKLAQAFVSDTPPAPLVQRLSQRFMETGGDIRAVLKTLFASEFFWDETAYQAKLKSPYRYVVSAARISSGQVHAPRPLLNVMRVMNMPLYQCLTPDGYKNTQAAWLGPDTLLQRINFATQLGKGAFSHGDNAALPNKVSDTELDDRLKSMVSPHTRSLLPGLDPALKISIFLASPEFLRY